MQEFAWLRINRGKRSIKGVWRDLVAATIEEIARNLLQSEPNPYGKNSMQ
jgi:hypothetical protein